MLRVTVVNEEHERLVYITDAKAVHIIAEQEDNTVVSHTCEKDYGLLGICNYILCTRAHINAILKRDKIVRKLVNKRKSLQKRVNKEAANAKVIRTESVPEPFKEYSDSI